MAMIIKLFVHSLFKKILFINIYKYKKILFLYGKSSFSYETEF